MWAPSKIWAGTLPNFVSSNIVTGFFKFYSFTVVQSKFPAFSTLEPWIAQISILDAQKEKVTWNQAN